jgi:molecular chaperone DnaK (HSP70)
MGRPIGIDLGTTRSAAACVDENGQPRILADSSGVSLIPSVVLFGDDGVLVGEIARDSAAAMPERVVECVKREMGDSVWRFVVDRDSYSAEDVSAFILKEVKRVAEEALGHPVTEAVITVPAYFYDAQRTATIRAGEKAGLQVLKIINEPTAAAMFHGLKDKQEGRFLVYDLGGGTFDVTVMSRNADGSLKTLSTCGNHRLGGKDWDERIVDYVAGAFADAHGGDPRTDPSALFTLRLRAEGAKCALTERDRTNIVCQFSGRSLTVELTRKVFEEMTAGLLRLTEQEVDGALREAKLTAQDIAQILLVGGASRMPMVKRLAGGKARAVGQSRDPDHCVALGAALEAARLRADSDLYKAPARRILLDQEVRDSTAHGLGNIALRNEDLVNAVIIPKNTEFPCERTRQDFATTYDDQDTVAVHLVQGEHEDILTCAPLKTYEFSGIPPRPAGASRIAVTYRYNENDVVEVSAVDAASGRPLRKSEKPLVDLLELREQFRREAKRLVARKRRVALLMDSSGSMCRDMDEAKQACRQFIADTNLGTVEMGLVQFGMDSEASIIHEMTTNAESLRAAVNKLDADGGTPMADAILLGIGMVGEGKGEAERFIVLFTDGVPDDKDRAVKAGEKAAGLEIKLLCIGIGQADETLLKRLATDQGVRLPASGQLVSTFSNVAQIVSGRRD